MAWRKSGTGTPGLGTPKPSTRDPPLRCTSRTRDSPKVQNWDPEIPLKIQKWDPIFLKKDHFMIVNFA